MKRRWVWALAIVLVLLVAGTLGYIGIRSKVGASPTGTSARVTRESLDVLVRSQGLIVAATTIEVKSRASGLVQAVHATAGDRVSKDQILLEVDPARSRLNEEEARSEVENARSQVRLMEESLDPDRVAMLRKKLQRQQDLLKADGIGSRQDVEAVEYELAAAERSLRSQQKQLEAAQLRLQTNMTRLRRMETESAFTIIRSPIDGVIMSRSVEVGSGVTSFSDSAQGGNVLFKIGSLDRLAFDGSLAVSDLTRVKPGLSARVASDAWSTGTVGTVSYVGQEAVAQTQSTSTTNRAPTFQVKVQLDAAAAKGLPLNVPATADIVISTISDALVVPFSCVRHLPNGQGILREAAGGAVRDRTVKLGPVTAGKVQILGDVPEGAEILGCGAQGTQGNQIAIRP